MLRKTRHKLKAILSGVYPGRFIRIGRDMTVTVKRNFMSLRSDKFKAEEVLATVVPDAIRDRDISIQCRSAVNKALEAKNFPKAIEEAYELFILIQNDIVGVKTPQKKSYVKSFRGWMADTWPVILSRIRQDPFGEIKTVTVHTKAKLEATRETLRGHAATGIKEFDEQFQTIMRYSPVAA